MTRMYKKPIWSKYGTSSHMPRILYFLPNSFRIRLMIKFFDKRVLSVPRSLLNDYSEFASSFLIHVLNTFTIHITSARVPQELRMEIKWEMVYKWKTGSYSKHNSRNYLGNSTFLSLGGFLIPQHSPDVRSRDNLHKYKSYIRNEDSMQWWADYRHNENSLWKYLRISCLLMAV